MSSFGNVTTIFDTVHVKQLFAISSTHCKTTKSKHTGVGKDANCSNVIS